MEHYYEDEREILGSRWNIDNVNDMLFQIASHRTPPRRALLRASACFHPQQVGGVHAFR